MGVDVGFTVALGDSFTVDSERHSDLSLPYAVTVLSYDARRIANSV